MTNASAGSINPASEPRSLVDTNIVVYAYDPTEPAKHTIANALLKRVSVAGQLVFNAPSSQIGPTLERTWHDRPHPQLAYVEGGACRATSVQVLAQSVKTER